MFDLEVFHVSILNDLRIHTWADVTSVTELLRASGYTITVDGHFVLRPKEASSAMRSALIDAITRRADKCALHLSGSVALKAFYRGSLYLGNIIHLEQIAYSDYKVPYVCGNFTDQQPGYTTLTIVCPKSVLHTLKEKWEKRFSRSSESAVYVSPSAAIQVRLCCDEVAIEDVIDVFVSGAFAIQHQHKGKMIVGQSYTEVLGAPSYKRIQRFVEEEFGPFNKSSSYRPA